MRVYYVTPIYDENFHGKNSPLTNYQRIEATVIRFFYVGSGITKALLKLPSGKLETRNIEELVVVEEEVITEYSEAKMFVRETL